MCRGRPVRWDRHHFPAAHHEALQAHDVVAAEGSADARVAASATDRHLAGSLAGVRQRVQGGLGLVHRASLGEHLANHLAEGRSVERPLA